MINKKTTTIFLTCLFSVFGVSAQNSSAVSVKNPEGTIQLDVNVVADGKPVYSVKLNGKSMVNESPLGFIANFGDFSKDLKLKTHNVKTKTINYTNRHIKKSQVSHPATNVAVTFETPKGRTMSVEFMLTANDVAFRYLLPKEKGTGSVRIMEEKTGFAIPAEATAFLTPQSDPMIGWKRTKPSYEEEYIIDAPLTQKSQYGHGFTFPALFRTPDNGWILVSETGTDRNYAGCRLSDYTDGIYQIQLPMAGENNGNGTVEPAFALPGATPWRTLTVADNLGPIVETTIPWDVVEPVYRAKYDYTPGRATWSWILWQDNSINEKDIRTYIDFAHDMGWEHTLIDNWWDTKIGKPKMEKLIKYARTKNVEPILWYSSSGYWNDIVQGPINMMDNPRIRHEEMAWLQSNGVKAIKVDFFGGDKQETMRLYEDILSDANDHGIMVIFHGCTLPRGWEKMYPNYIGSEAVLASENLVFSQHFCDKEAENASLHPFIRNTVGAMEFGGTLLNKRHNRNNDGGSVRKTTDAFELATAVIFQSPAQNFALAPNNLTDAPADAIDVMKGMPNLWDDVKFIDGYPGRYAVLARRHGDTWYVAGINAETAPKQIKVDLSAFGSDAQILSDDKSGTLIKKTLKLKKGKSTVMTMQPNGGFISIIK